MYDAAKTVLDYQKKDDFLYMRYYKDECGNNITSNIKIGDLPFEIDYSVFCGHLIRKLTITIKVPEKGIFGSVHFRKVLEASDSYHFKVNDDDFDVFYDYKHHYNVYQNFDVHSYYPGKWEEVLKNEAEKIENSREHIIIRATKSMGGET